MLLNMDMTNAFLTLLVTFTALVAYFVYARYRLFNLLQELGFSGPRPHFIKGNSPEMQFGSDLPLVSIAKWSQKYGKVFGYYMGTVPTVVIGDVELIKQMAIKDFQHFSDRWTPASRLNIAGTSLLSLRGQRWKTVRKTLTPAFSAVKLRHLTPIMKRAVDDFDTGLQKVTSRGKEFDIYDRFQRLTLDVIGESALAMKINCQDVDNNILFKNMKSITTVGNSSSSAVGILLTYFPELIKFFKFVILRRPAIKSVIDVIRNLKGVIETRRGQSTVKTVDMLQLMLDAAAEDGQTATSTNTEPLTDDELIGNCFVFVLGGFETTATTLGYLAHALAMHPHIQDRIYHEIKSTVHDLTNVTYDDANSLSYLDQVINEVLRFYTPVWIVTRTCTKEYNVEGKKIPMGMKVEIPIYNIHHDPELWPEPDKFDPERFSAENKGQIHPAAFIPFGIGPRNCIGMRFSLLETRLTIIQLLIKYRLVPSKNTSMVELMTPSVTHVPKNGVFIQVELR